MTSSQTITPTLLVLGASKSASPSAEPKVNNTFNQVFKNEVASKTKKTPVEPVKNPVLNKSTITPSNSTSTNNKNSAPPASSPDITTNAATDTVASNSNNNEAQSSSVDQINEDKDGPEDHKLPDLSDPVSLFNFVNKINELSQANTSSVPAENDDMSKTPELLPTAVASNLDADTPIAPPTVLNTSELTPPEQGSEINVATSTLQESVEGSLPQSRFMSELSTAKDSKLTTSPAENQRQLTSSQKPTTTAVVTKNIADNKTKEQATLNQLSTQPELGDAVNLSREIPNKAAPPSSESSRISIANSNAKTKADLMPTTSSVNSLDNIDKTQRVLTPPLSSNTETASSNIDTPDSSVLVSQNSADNSIDIRSISDKTNPPLTPPPSSNSRTALGKIDATQSTGLTNQLKTNNVDETHASLSKVDPLIALPPSSNTETILGKIAATQSRILGNQSKTNDANDARVSLSKIDTPLAAPPSFNTESAIEKIDTNESAVLANQLKTNNVNDTHVTLNKIDPQLAPPPSSNTESVLGKFDATQATALASQLKTNNVNDTRATSQVDKSRTPPALNELNKSISESLAASSQVDLINRASSQNQNFARNVESPSPTNTQKLTLPAVQAPVVSLQIRDSSELANDLSTVSLVNPAAPETNIHKASKNTETALTTSTQVQALPAAPVIVIPIQTPSDSTLASAPSPLPLLKTIGSETNASQISHGVEKPEQSNSMLGSSELFSSALNTEFARAQQEQTVAQESHAIEEFAVNKMTAEVATPAPIVQAPPAALSSLPVTEYIAARFGTKAWDQAIGQKIVWMVAGSEQTAQLTLNPPDLGPVQVVLSISDNFVDASFVSSHLDVREAIEAAAPKLREMMDNAGISLSGFSVSAESAQSGNQYNAEKSQNNNQSQTRNASNANEASDSIKLNTPAQRTQPELGLVDTFA